MRKIKQIRAEKIDILIIDEVGSEYIKYCIPDRVQFSVLPIRNVIPVVLNFNFFIGLISKIIRIRDIKRSVLFSVVDSLSPRVIITFIDNSPVMSKIQLEYPERLCISVQNGARAGFGGQIGAFSRCTMPVLYGFGEYEGEMINNAGVKCREYIASGSLRYSIYNKNYRNSDSVKHDICYISEWFSNDTFGCGIDDELLSLIREYHKNIFLYLIKFCYEQSLTLSVSMRNEIESDYYDKEASFYEALDNKQVAELIPNDVSDLRSYRTASSCSVVVCINSTLGYEMYGAGMRVLFCASADQLHLAKMLDAEGAFDNLPRMVCLDEMKYDSFMRKVALLLDIKEDLYFKNTLSSKKYYMNNMDDTPVDDLIKEKIREYLESN